MALFGALGYACMEGLRGAINSYRGTKWTYLTKEPLFFLKAMAIPSTHAAVVCGGFILVDRIAQQLFVKYASPFLKENTFDSNIMIARMTFSAYATAKFAELAGVRLSFGFAACLITVCMIGYNRIRQEVAQFTLTGTEQEIKKLLQTFLSKVQPDDSSAESQEEVDEP